MTTSAVIRPAQEADIAEMTSLLRELFTIEADFQFDEFKQRRGLARLLDSSGGKIWVAEAQGGVVGLCTLQVLISTAEGGPVGLIEDVVIAKGWRGQGLGRRLLEAAETWARTNGLSRLQLLADCGNRPALNFYHHLNWQETRLIGLRKSW